LLSGSTLALGAGTAGGSGTTSETGSVATSTSTTHYVVQPGDTLTAIAARAGTTVSQLATANGLDPNAPLPAGSTLALGAGMAGLAGGRETATETQSAATSQPVGEAAEGPPGAPPYPTAQSVTPGEVSSIASSEEVPAALATAIAYQESGFNNELVSSAGARGVMQITPGTWSWIGEALAGPTALSPASASDNVRGGVLLLHSLLQATGGDEPLAIAGYYQGLPSVRENGMYPSTEQYVADVQALQRRFEGE
jgi:soluble lytic murein transglycosylase-like protein